MATILNRHVAACARVCRSKPGEAGGTLSTTLVQLIEQLQRSLPSDVPDRGIWEGGDGAAIAAKAAALPIP
jgi:hypothetical protein